MQIKTKNFETVLSTKVSFTLITGNDRMTKVVKPDGNGGIEKKTAAQMTSGKAQRTEVQFGQLGGFIRNLKPNQAITHGVPVNHGGDDFQEFRIRLSGRENSPGTISRSKKFFEYPNDSYHLAMFDHDPKPGQHPMAIEDFIKTIIRVVPAFKTYPTMWTPSTSSCVYDTLGKQLTDEGNGFHLYFPFKGNVKGFADILYKRLWLERYGYIFISKAGTMLERTIFDLTVFSPERLDFVAGAECIDCEQRLPAPVFRLGLDIIE